MFDYLLTYICGFLTSILYHDYISIAPEINYNLNKIKNENKNMSDLLQIMTNKLDEVIYSKETGYNMRRASP